MKAAAHDKRVENVTTNFQNLKIEESANPSDSSQSGSSSQGDTSTESDGEMVDVKTEEEDEMQGVQIEDEDVSTLACPRRFVRILSIISQEYFALFYTPLYSRILYAKHA